MAEITREAVNSALDAVRPELVKHGGNVEVLGVNSEGVVLVRLTGACSGCKHASATLKDVVEKGLKERLPGVARVEAVM